MEKKTIWHRPEEKLPTEFQTVVFYVGEFIRIGMYEQREKCFYDFYTGHDYPPDSVEMWIDVKDLIATSKALDVAIESLTKIWKQPEDMADVRDAEDTLKKSVKL